MKNLNLSQWNNRELFDAIITELLSRFEHIPSQGVIIAGQAVASACYRVVGLFEHGPMKDLDVFGLAQDLPKPADWNDDVTYDESTRKYVRYRSDRTSKVRRLNGLSDMSIEENSGGFMLSDSASTDGYIITNSFRDPLHADINYIEVDFSGRNTLSGALILNGFDINACEIALDMKTQTVVWTDAFQDFLFRPWLSCTYLGTPMHTAIRLCKKIKALPFAHIHLDDEMRKLQSSLAVILHYGQSMAKIRATSRKGDYNVADRMPGNILSPVYAGRFRDVQDTLSTYFSLHDYPCKFDNTIIKEESDTPDFISYEREYHEDVVVERLMYRMHPITHDEYAVRSFVQAWFCRGAPTAVAEHTAIHLEDISRLFSVWYGLCREHHGKTGIDKLLRIPLLSERHSSTNHALLLMRHLKNRLRDVRQASDSSLARLYKMFFKHPLAFSRVLPDQSDFNIEVQIASQFRWLEKNKMHYYIGWLENGALDKNDRTRLLSNRRDPVDDAYDYPSLLATDFRTRMKDIHDAYISTIKSRVFQPQLSRLLRGMMDNFPWISLRELTSEYDFYWEGQCMGHCVGGHYAGAKNFSFSVISIDSAPTRGELDSRSTLQLNFFNYGGRMQVSQGQHYGVGNAYPCDDNEQIAIAIIERANEVVSDYNRGVHPRQGDDFFDCYQATTTSSRKCILA